MEDIFTANSKNITSFQDEFFTLAFCDLAIALFSNKLIFFCSFFF